MLKKIADLPKTCMSPEHNPPGHIVLSPGIWEHTCPGCGDTTTFTVAGYTHSGGTHPPTSVPSWTKTYPSGTTRVSEGSRPLTFSRDPIKNHAMQSSLDAWG